MGARFYVEHANFVAYLTATKRQEAPRTEVGTLITFLETLAYGNKLISSKRGTGYDWTQLVANTARAQLSLVSPLAYSEFLDPPTVEYILYPLRQHFTGYSLYAMLVPAGSPDEDLKSFQYFAEMAIKSRAEALILMPDNLPHEPESIMDPFPAIQALAESPIKPPLVVYWTPRGSTCIFPLGKAISFFRNVIVDALSVTPPRIEEIFAFLGSEHKRKRILHLSDLHIGSEEANRRRRWLKEHLAQELPSIDKVVITGDLFDNPAGELRESFDELRTDIENITGSKLLVIPGNHDVRKKGNALGRFGRNTEHITDLRWSPISIDHKLQTVFFSFNSSESGNFAKGAVSERQRLDRSALFDREVRLNSQVKNYIRVALVHHHPYAYNTAPRSTYERVIAAIFRNDESFVAFEDAEKFIEWCAARDISLVLHGHKHVPRWIETEIPIGDETRNLTIVGCGSTTGVGGRPMCYDIIVLDPETKRWNVMFFHDEKGDGSGFRIQNLTLDLRPGSR